MSLLLATVCKHLRGKTLPTKLTPILASKLSSVGAPVSQCIIGDILPLGLPSNKITKLPSPVINTFIYPSFPSGLKWSGIAEPSMYNHVYYMGNLLKKRKRKMNRQKYKKRRKRDRFKRAALKNLRERKKQRKERAFNRKQEFLSKMIVNKDISKRRARYLSHKLLPNVNKEKRAVN